MRIEKSTTIKEELRPFLVEVVETGEPIGIKLGAAVVAYLTLDRPERGTPPLKIKVEEARAGWSELLQCVICLGGKFSFIVRTEGGQRAHRVYLRRVPEHRNAFCKAWSEHRDEHLAAQGDPMQELREELTQDLKDELGGMMQAMLDASVSKLGRKIGIAFAGVTRAHLHATPENGMVPLRDASSLERVESD